MTEPLLLARDLHMSFGTSRALTGASVDVLPGEILALLGPSGSGKSTLLHCLAGILRPDSGRVTLAGKRIDDLPDEQRSALRRTSFGFVFQFGALVPELSAVDNVALPLRLNGEGRRAAREQAHTWLERLEVAEVADKVAGDMSGGQAQRVAVARALVHQPRVVFADEPTGALDSFNGELVMELLVGAARDLGTSVVLVTHESRIAAYADREVVLRDGALAATART
jgi:putative ABC transport system ATP-binding protein